MGRVPRLVNVNKSPEPSNSFVTIPRPNGNILDIRTPEDPMCTACVEDEITKLGDEISKIYFNAKHELASIQDSRSEQFSRAAKIVRAFWKRVGSSQHGEKLNNLLADCGDGYASAGGVGLVVRMPERKRSSAAPAAGTMKPMRRLWN